MFKRVALISALGGFVVAGMAYADKPIRNFSRWVDVDGNPISCHDGAIARFGDTFYWYGTSYRGNPNGLWGRKGTHLQNGFNVYSSRNLVDWKHVVSLGNADRLEGRQARSRAGETAKAIIGPPPWFYCRVFWPVVANDTASD
jgi:hypothetical protein